jgi:hypothetical protein
MSWAETTGVNHVAADVNRIADAIEQAIAAGLEVPVPTVLADACQRINALHVQQPSPDARRGRSSGEREPLDGGLASKVPLRQLILTVVKPGEEVRVSTVVERLERRGARWDAQKVSNALSYWVHRGRLKRVRQGLYHVPLEFPDVNDDDRLSAPDDHPERHDVIPPQREETEHDRTATWPKRQAM